MRNRYLSEKVAADIDGTVAKILKDLGNPEPPLRLELVREVLKLDRAYYTVSDESTMRELVHRLTLAGKQIVKRPMLLWDAIKAFDLKALYVPDRKRILLSSELPTAKQRWNEAHETLHSVIPWHEYLMHGDNEQSVSPACHAQVESEANFGAGRLLFMQDRFVEEMRSSPLNIKSVQKLSKAFGNTITSTLWRTVEHMDVPALAIISDHPHYPGEAFNPAEPLKYLIRSRAFAKCFGEVTDTALFTVLGQYCKYVKRGPLGESEVSVSDANGEKHVFHFETFNNTYDTLTLGTYRAKKLVAVAMSL